MADTPISTFWMSLVVGNTRLHWGLFEDRKLVGVRHTPHLVTLADIDALIGSGFSYPDWRRPRSLWVASVVPEQTALCLQSSIDCYLVERSRIPLANLYDTLGVDRAINLLGARARIGWPAVVVDVGTALTFTAGYDAAAAERSGEPRRQVTTSHRRAAIYGGAILPGIRLQAGALSSGTAALEEAAMQFQYAFGRDDHKQDSPKRDSPKRDSPETGNLKSNFVQNRLPQRWATDTEGAIASGILYGTLAALTDTLTDWWQRFPNGKAVLTGGDGPKVHQLLQQTTPEIASRVALDGELMFYGLCAYRQSAIARRCVEER